MHFEQEFVLGRLNNIKVMNLHGAIIQLDRTHHSQSVFGAKDKTITVFFVREIKFGAGSTLAAS